MSQEGAPAPPVAGQLIGGKYRLVSPLGRGAMGTVWRAHRVDWDAPIALKLMVPELYRFPEFLSRFEREVRLAAGLRSSHVVQILDHGIDPSSKCPFIAMELLEGEPLSLRIRRLSRLSEVETFQILTHIVRALSRAHTSGVVHRDLKPDNVFIVDNDGEVLAKILDFGVAKWSPASLQDALTRPGSVLGTPLYMSPEQIRGLSDIDHRADLWSLSVIACECLTGRRPFAGADFAEVAALLHDPSRHPKPSSLGPVPPEFDSWFARAVHPDISRGFQTARELLEALAPICGSGSLRLSASQPKTPEPLGESTVIEGVNTWQTVLSVAGGVPARRAWMALAVLSVTLLVSAGAFLLFRPAGSVDAELDLTERTGQTSVNSGAPSAAHVAPLRTADAVSPVLGRAEASLPQPIASSPTPQSTVHPAIETAAKLPDAEPAGSGIPERANRRKPASSHAKRESKSPSPAPDPTKSPAENLEVAGRRIRTTLE